MLSNLSRLSNRSFSLRAFSSAFPVKFKDENLFRLQGYINGSWVSAQGNKTIEVKNPATGEVIAKVPNMGSHETNDAIAAASKVNLSWRNAGAKKRAQILRQWYSLIVSHKEDLATIMTLENGKPLQEALNEVLYAASFVELYSEEATRVLGEIIPAPVPGSRILVQRQAVGIVGAITPWNFPSAMVTRKVAPALAAGCPVVLKPSELTPLSALALVELANRAGVPSGVLNVVLGDAPAIGQALTSNPLVRKITFTGSTRVGKLLLRGVADNVQRISLELGGNAPFIVFNDADLTKAVAGTIACKFRNGGQTCVSANRIFVQSGIYDRYAEALTKAVAAIKIGNGLKPNVQLGPLINRQSLEKVESLVKDASSKGGRVTTGGSVGSVTSEFGPVSSGLLYQPTVITKATPDMEIFSMEVFGPVAPLYKFDTEEEALKLANNTRAGLAAYFYTADVSRMFRLGEGLDYGMVGINVPIISHPVAPFGGIKESGLGKEGSHHGLKEYFDIKAIHVGVDE